MPLCCAVAAVLLAACPECAFATYADCDREAPAAQDLGTIGSPIYAAEIPDGTYEVEARTDSSMCVFYRSADEAEAKAPKEKCYVQVANGKMTAIFYMTGMYTRLHLGGTADDAAALTNKDGSDDSKYLRGDPADGYVSHLYAMAIPALNYPMYFAAFAGGKYPVSSDPASTWHTRAKWYSHAVVFKPTKALLDAIAGKGQEPEPEPEAKPETTPVPAPAGTPEAMPASDESLAGIAQSLGDGSGSGETGGRRGVEISPASFDVSGGEGGGDVNEIEQIDMADGLPPVSVEGLAAAVVALLVVGAGYRVIAYAAARRAGRVAVAERVPGEIQAQA